MGWSKWEALVASNYMKVLSTFKVEVFAGRETQEAGIADNLIQQILVKSSM